MLCLRRFVGESIVIDGRITVTVQKINRGGLVVLGIDAPREITIRRKKVHQKILANAMAQQEADKPC